MASLREQGEYFRLALAMGLLDHSTVIAWADSEIERTETPCCALIDVALAGRLSRNDLIKLLAGLPGSADLELAAHRALGLLKKRYRQGEITMQAAIQSLQAYYSWASVPESEGLQAYNFDDALICAEYGYYGTTETVRAELEAFLAAFGCDPEAGGTTACN